MPFPQVILDADVFISVPCLKTHIHADHTVTLKNSFGCTPQWKRSEVHSQYLLEEFLVDLNRVRSPDLIIVDGLVRRRDRRGRWLSASGARPGDVGRG